LERVTLERQLIGKIGEEAACQFLQQQGYAIIENNFRCSLGEIDIVARDQRVTVIVEVRTRTSLTYGSPEESITTEKARRLKRLALSYLQNHHLSAEPCRIDLIAVMVDRKTRKILSINHIKGILTS
jgi:putative endonuclease